MERFVFQKEIKTLIIVLLGLIFFCCFLLGCKSRMSSEGVSSNVTGLGSFSLKVIDTVNLEINNTSPSVLKTNIEDGTEGIWWHNGRGNQVFKNSFEGEMEEEFNIPMINEPYGLNSVSDFFVFNQDSLFVFDSQFLRLLLLGRENNIKDFWDLTDFWPNPAPTGIGKIVDIYINKNNDLVVEISGYQDYYPGSYSQFYEYTQLLHRLNLSKRSFETSGIKYPLNSPFRNELFWTGTFPFIVRCNKSYVVTFPIDPDLYVYSPSLELTQTLKLANKNFPITSGGKPFRSAQLDDNALITRKLNGFGLYMQNAFEIEGSNFIIRTYIKPLGNDSNIPDDILSFSSKGFRSAYILQLFREEDGFLVKIGEDLHLDEFEVSTYIGLGENNLLNFIKYNPNSEEKQLIRMGLKVEIPST